MKAFLLHALTNWKTSLSSLLTIMLASTGCLLALPSMQSHTEAIAILGVVQALAKLYLGMMQTDADKTTKQ